MLPRSTHKYYMERVSCISGTRRRGGSICSKNVEVTNLRSGSQKDGLSKVKVMPSEEFYMTHDLYKTYSLG